MWPIILVKPFLFFHTICKDKQHWNRQEFLHEGQIGKANKSNTQADRRQPKKEKKGQEERLRDLVKGEKWLNVAQGKTIHSLVCMSAKRVFIYKGMDNWRLSFMCHLT